MKYALISATILLAATSIADAKQFGRGNRPALGINRCEFSIAKDCNQSVRKAEDRWIGRQSR